jgi:hypothetical protein
MNNMKKCLHCERPVDFIPSKGWSHMPEGRPYVMQHEYMDDKRLASYNRGMDFKRGHGCGWIGVQPADQITYQTDICPKCGAQGELADHHIASPSNEKADLAGLCSAPDKCQRADKPHCDCACNGANHGVQGRIFI